MAILAIDTQYLENYGDEINPHWKPKGGSTYLVTDHSDSGVINLDVDELRNLINYRNSASEEYVIGVHMEADNYCSDFEKWQKEDAVHGLPGGVYYDTRIERCDDGVYVATEQFKGPRGEFAKIWNMRPGGEQDNYSYTEKAFSEEQEWDEPDGNMELDAERMEDDNYNEHQPTEYDEWMDFDPDC
jgi:hypothetical protein